ncbi:MAG TPA: hypothetical protein DCP31_10720 [Cyanobacteria bacterium UBA8543]|nr:hypothetical protein [Cyanobacteria bacterium UBA8543]
MLPSCLWAGKEDGWFSNRRDRLIVLFARMDACSISNIPKKYYLIKRLFVKHRFYQASKGN